MNRVKAVSISLVLSFLLFLPCSSHANVVWYALDNVTLDDGTQMSGMFSWTYDIDDFENGEGQFSVLDIPHTAHDHTDLEATFDVGRSIEITYPGNLHDDGVDITWVLLQELTPTSVVQLDLTESAYEIGGNGFHTGVFTQGSIAPIDVVLSIEAVSSDFVRVSWLPALPGYVLQESTTLDPVNWILSPSGTVTPVVLPVSVPRKFYRVVTP